MNLIKCLILLLLVYEVVSGHKKKKHHKKCHKKKCCKRHKEVPHVEEIHHLSGKDDHESISPFHKENVFKNAEREFAAFKQIFKPNVGEHHDHFTNDHPNFDLPALKPKEHDGLLDNKFLNNEHIHKEFIDEHEDTHNFLKKLLNKFFRTLFEKHFNHNKELIKNPLIDHLDDDCKNSLKLLIGKCFETVENKDCLKKLIELPLKDVFDEENMNHLHNLFGDHENKEHILDHLSKLPLNAVLNHKIKEHIFEKDLGNHEDIFENFIKLPLTDIFEIKEHLVLKTQFDEKLGEMPEKMDHFHLEEDIHSTHEDKGDLLKFLVGKHIVEEDVKEDITENVLKTLITKLIIAKKMLIEQEKTKILKELIAHSIKAHVKDHINQDEQFALKALLIKLGEEIIIKSILKEKIERSVKDHINHDEQFVVKALLTTLMGEDILIKSALKETVEHSKINEKELSPKHIEEDDKENEVKEKLLKVMILKHLLNHQNKPEEVPVEKEEINAENQFKRNDDTDLDFDKLKEQLQKLIIPEQANPVESYIIDKKVDPVENRYIIDVPANPEEDCIIDIPANPLQSFIIDTPPENVKDFDKADPGLWDYYYNQFAHFIDQESDEDICIGCNYDDENVYYTYEY